MKYAQEIGAAIKLPATSCKVDDGFYAMVCPGMINESSPLYSVNGVFNAIFIHGNVLGDAMFYGSGAGKLPTASAVVADVVDEAKHLHRNIMMNWSSRTLKLCDVSTMENRFFVRVKGSVSEKIDKVNEIFGRVEPISLPAVPGEFAFITKKMKESEFKAKADQMGEEILGRIRVFF